MVRTRDPRGHRNRTGGLLGAASGAAQNAPQEKPLLAEDVFKNLTHASGATRQDAVFVLDATHAVLAAFGMAVIRHESGSPIGQSNEIQLPDVGSARPSYCFGFLVSAAAAGLVAAGFGLGVQKSGSIDVNSFGM